MKLMHTALSLSAAMAIAGIAFGTTPAAAANSAMADCNKQWNDAKAANKANAGTYQDFLKSCLKAAPAATDAKATDTKATDTKAADKKAADMKAADAKAAEMKAADAKAKTGAAATDTAAVTPDPMAKEKKECGKQWKDAKAAATTGTQKKKDFVADCLAKMAPAADKTKAATVAPVVVPAKTVDAKAVDTMAKDEATPPEPTADAKAVDAKTVDANGKVRTPGQLAMDKRIKECGGMWQIAKKDNTTGGLKWPQYWSACNKKLKAAAN